MGKRFDWDKTNRENRVRSHGSLDVDGPGYKPQRLSRETRKWAKKHKAKVRRQDQRNG